MSWFRRKSRAPRPVIDTGHPGDDQLLAMIADGSDLAAPRHWVHYLYVPGEGAARAAADEIVAAGWQLQCVDVAADGGPQWVVVAERHDAVTSPEAVAAARGFFEQVAARHGGEYDGWEASL